MTKLKIALNLMSGVFTKIKHEYSVRFMKNYGHTEKNTKQFGQKYCKKFQKLNNLRRLKTELSSILGFFNQFEYEGSARFMKNYNHLEKYEETVRGEILKKSQSLNDLTKLQI